MSLNTSEDIREFRGSRKKHFIGCGIFVAISAVMLGKFEDFPPMIVLSGVCLVLALALAWQAVTRSTVLRLDANGFEYSNSLTEKKRYTWAETCEFTPDSYAVSFRQKESGEQMVPSLFDATTDEIWKALTAHHQKYGAAPVARSENA
jgi:hypothetical protein